MDAITWLLVNGANAWFWLWEGIKTLFGGLFAALNTVLNPILSNLLRVLNPICTWIGDVVYAPLALLPIWLGLTIVSALAGIIMLIAFRYLSNQPAIGKAKDDIKANLLALKLYKDELRVTFKSQFRLLGAIGRLQRYMLTPVLWMLLPMLLALAQMGIRYQWRPLRQGEQTIIRMKLAAEYADPLSISLEPSRGLTVEVGPVPAILPDGAELVWRVRGAEPGRHLLRFDVGGTVVEKELVVGDRFERVSAVLPSSAWSTQLLHPAERPLPRNVPVQTIEIHYPERPSRVYGANFWVLSFFVISMLFALVFRPLFNVRF